MEIGIIEKLISWGFSPVNIILLGGIIQLWILHKSNARKMQEKSDKDDLQMRENSQIIIRLAGDIGELKGRIFELERQNTELKQELNLYKNR